MTRICLLLFVVLVALSASPAFAGVRPLTQQPQLAREPVTLCLAQYVWDDGWRSPYPRNTMDILDLRTIPEMARAGREQGFGLFILDSPGLCFDGPASTVLASLGPSLDRTLNVSEKLAFELAMNHEPGAIQAETLRDALWELFTSPMLTDPTGETHVKPLRGSVTKGPALTKMGYGVIKSSPLDAAGLNNSIAVYRADYTTRRNAGESLVVLRRFTGATMLNLFGEASSANFQRIIPSEYRHDGWTRPESVVMDKFTDTNGTALTSHNDSGGASWSDVQEGDWEIQGNFAHWDDAPGGESATRTGTALSSTDMRVQASTETFTRTSSNIELGVIWRKDGTATETFYVANLQEDAGGTELQLRKYVSGTPSDVATAVADSFTSGAYINAVHDSADLIVVDYDGTEVFNTTDSSITSGTYPGVFADGGSSDVLELDEFDAIDLAVTEMPDVPPGSIRIPAESEFTDHGVILSPVTSTWEDRYGGSVHPSITRKGDTLYLYYVGADGDRGDGGPANRKVGLATCPLSADCTNSANWTKDSNNPIWDHVAVHDETGTFSMAPVTRDDDSIVLFLGNMVDDGAGGVNDDVDVITTQDGFSSETSTALGTDGDEIRVLSHDDPAVLGSGDEIDPVAAWHDGTNWNLYYNSPSGDGFNWTIFHISCSDFDECDTTSDSSFLVGDTTDPQYKNMSVAYLDDDTLLVFAGIHDGGDTASGDDTRPMRWDLRLLDKSTPGTVDSVVRDTYTFSDTIGEGEFFLDPEDNIWYFAYLEHEDPADIGIMTAAAQDDTGVVTRYYIDEADDGQSPTDLLDAEPLPLDLAITYDGANPDYIETSANRGLEWTTTSSNGIAKATIDATKVKTQMHGNTGGSIVTVAQFDAASDARTGAIGTTGGTERFSLIAAASNELFFFKYNSDVTGGVWNSQWTDNAVHCWVVVYDSTLATAGDRIKLYRDGSLQTKSSGTNPAQNTTIDLSSGQTMTVGNRVDGSRSPDGVIYYVAFHSVALSSAEVTETCDTLLADDDTPGRRVFSVN